MAAQPFSLLSFLLTVGGKRDDIEREKTERESKGKGRREERRREQVDLLINNHKVRQAVPGWVGPVRKQQLRICRACKGLKQHRSAFFVPLARALKGQGDTCWWLRSTVVQGRPGQGSAQYQLAQKVDWRECYSSQHQRDVLYRKSVHWWCFFSYVTLQMSSLKKKKKLLLQCYYNSCWCIL